MNTAETTTATMTLPFFKQNIPDSHDEKKATDIECCPVSHPGVYDYMGHLYTTSLAS